jgi:hypothetical protein
MCCLVAWDGSAGVRPTCLDTLPRPGHLFAVPLSGVSTGRGGPLFGRARPCGECAKILRCAAEYTLVAASGPWESEWCPADSSFLPDGGVDWSGWVAAWPIRAGGIDRRPATLTSIPPMCRMFPRRAACSHADRATPWPFLTSSLRLQRLLRTAFRLTEQFFHDRLPRAGNRPPAFSPLAAGGGQRGEEGLVVLYIFVEAISGSPEGAALCQPRLQRRSRERSSLHPLLT